MDQTLDAVDRDVAVSERATNLSWGRVAVLGAALAFLGFAVGLFVSRDRYPREDSVAVGFYQDMLVHHDQALEMATLAVTKAENLVVRSFAREVLTFQSRENGIMETALHEWGYGRADRSDTAMAWMGMPVPLGEMPGLASEEEMDRLQDAQGAEVDALFLQLMATHHASGIHMAEYAAAEAEEHDVRELAARMAYNQAVEINEYSITAERLGLPVTIDKVAIPDPPT